MTKQLTDFEKDQLREVINIGAGNGFTALARLVDRKITAHVPEVIAERIEKIPRCLGELEDVVVAVLLKLLGEASGFMLLVFPRKSALELADLLTRGYKKEIKVLDEIDRSALQEVGNILSGASLTALSKFLDINIIQSVPDTATDMWEAIIDSILAEIGTASESILLFKVEFSIGEREIEGNLFFLFDPQATDKILTAIRKKFEGT